MRPSPPLNPMIPQPPLHLMIRSPPLNPMTPQPPLRLMNPSPPLNPMTSQPPLYLMSRSPPLNPMTPREVLVASVVINSVTLLWYLSQKVQWHTIILHPMTL